MKKTILMAAAILITASAQVFAGDNNNEKPSSLKTSYQLPFTKLQVKNDIDIRLVENTEKSISFSGSDAAIAKVNWKIKNGILYISAKKGASLKNKVTITVNVTQLEALEIRGNSEVRSEGKLGSALLKVFMDGSCTVDLQNRGTISIYNETDNDLDVKKAVGDVKFG
jgi:hypothetical protein